MFCGKGVLRNFAKFTWKHLYQSLFFDKVAGPRLVTLLKKRLWHRCFLVNCVKFLKMHYRKTWFHVNGVNNYFIILCIFPNISFWRQSIFFPSFFWNQNRLGFKEILEIKLSDKSIVSKKGWKKNKGKLTSQFS